MESNIKIRGCRTCPFMKDHPQESCCDTGLNLDTDGNSFPVSLYSVPGYWIPIWCPLPLNISFKRGSN